MGLERAEPNGRDADEGSLSERMRKIDARLEADDVRYGLIQARLDTIALDTDLCKKAVIDLQGRVSGLAGDAQQTNTLVRAIAKGMGVSIPPEVTRDSTVEVEQKVEKRVRTPLEWGKLIGAIALAATAAAAVLDQVARILSSH